MSELENLPPYYFVIFTVGGLLVTALLFASRSMYTKVAEMSLAKQEYTRPLRQQYYQQQAIASCVIGALIVLVWVVAITLVMGMLGANPVHTLVAMGIGIVVLLGFFREWVGETMQGYAILAGHHYLPGDFIQVTGGRGHVIHFTFRTTTLRTPTGERVTLPNSRCIPSQRHVRGYTSNYLDLVLADPQQIENAQKLLLRVGQDLNDTDEMVREVPEVVVVLTRHEDRRPILRWRIRTLPGSEEAVVHKAVGLAKRVFEAGNVRIVEEPSVFRLNGLETFRDLFHRRLPDPELRDLIQAEEQKPPSLS